MSRLPTLGKIFTNIKNIFFRFPAAVMLSVIATISALVVVNNSVDEKFIFFKLIWLCVFACIYATITALASEKFKLKKSTNIALQIAASILCFGYYIFLPQDSTYLSTPSFVRLFILSGVGFIFLISFPYDFKNSGLLWGYWTGVLKALLISVVLALGISVVLQLSYMAADSLFHLDYWWDHLMESYWTINFSLMAPLIFLHYLPSVTEPPVEKPKLKLLDLCINFVWLPAVALFFVILYIYLGNIVFTWNWPSGGVANWIIAFSVIGILGYIFSYNYVEEKMRKTYFTLFFALTIPMTAILFMAIGFRLKMYGVTESRYMVVAAGIWILLVATYILFSKRKQLSFIPYVTIVMLLISVIGPWSMSSVSARSQIKRLQNLFVKNQILINGKIAKLQNPKVLSEEDITSMNSILYYLSEQQTLLKIQPWFATDLKIPSGPESNSRPSSYYNTMLTNIRLESGLPEYYYSLGSLSTFDFYSSPNIPIADVRGYDFYMGGVALQLGYHYVISSDNFGQISVDLGNSNRVDFFKNGTLVASIDLSPQIAKLGKEYESGGYSRLNRDVPDIPDISFENNNIKMKLEIRNATIDKKQNDWEIRYINLQIAGSWKK